MPAYFCRADGLQGVVQSRSTPTDRHRDSRSIKNPGNVTTGRIAGRMCPCCAKPFKKPRRRRGLNQARPFGQNLRAFAIYMRFTTGDLGFEGLIESVLRYATASKSAKAAASVKHGSTTGQASLRAGCRGLIRTGHACSPGTISAVGRGPPVRGRQAGPWWDWVFPSRGEDACLRSFIPTGRQGPWSNSFLGQHRAPILGVSDRLPPPPAL